MPVFAAHLFPGDTAVVRLTSVKKGFARAELVQLIAPSPLRRLEPCPVAGECGGCDWTALRLDAQLAAKKRIVEESLRRIGKIDPAGLPPIRIHPSPLNYRMRSRLHRDGDRIGFYAAGSNEVVTLSDACEVVGPETARRFGRASLDHPGKMRSGPAREVADSVEEEGPGVEIWEVEGRLIEAGDLELVLDGFRFHLTTDSFFQVNRHLLSTMLGLVGRLAGRVRERRRAIDLYGGVGFFALPLAQHFEQVVTVEGSPASHRNARCNAPANVEAVHQPVERYVTRMPEANLIFLDPPRAGARPEVIDAIAASRAEVIGYLSCDPVTFSRDAGRLTAAGWRIASLDLLDLFPNTHHVETFASLERAR
jgi:SAM-dependent methyltransferases related to tRNA (uracil-5-)-methyltransferase